ncbi:hypothetical protein GEMRC1_013129 [Eukaryota sp. GEM-RC1]
MFSVIFSVPDENSVALIRIAEGLLDFPLKCQSLTNIIEYHKNLFDRFPHQFDQVTPGCYVSPIQCSDLPSNFEIITLDDIHLNSLTPSVRIAVESMIRSDNHSSLTFDRQIWNDA